MNVKINEIEVTLPASIGRDERTGYINVTDKNNEVHAIRIRDLSVSRKHCVVVERKTGGVSVIDLSSKNGTKINGRRMPAGEPYYVDETTDIEIGNTTITLQLS